MQSKIPQRTLLIPLQSQTSFSLQKVTIEDFVPGPSADTRRLAALPAETYKEHDATEGGSSDEGLGKLTVDGITMEESNADRWRFWAWEIWDYVWMKRVVNGIWGGGFIVGLELMNYFLLLYRYYQNEYHAYADKVHVCVLSYVIWCLIGRALVGMQNEALFFSIFFVVESPQLGVKSAFSLL